MSWSQENGSRPVTELQHNMEILKDVPFFEGFPPEVMKLLAYLAIRGDYEEEDVLFEKGDDPGFAFAVVKGEVAVFREGSKGEERLRNYGEGEFLGSFSLLGPMPSLFTMKAVTTTRLLIINREQFSKVMDQHRELAPLLRKAVLKQLIRWEQANIDELESCCLQKVGVTLL